MKLPDSIAELERLAADDSRPDVQIRASQKLTEVTASLITNREKPLFTRVRVNGETVLLDCPDREELERQANLAQVAVMQCREHTRSIKCACLAQFRQWFWNLQQSHPNASLTLAASDLWDRLEAYSKTYEKQSRTDSTLEALATMVSNLAAQNDGMPEWFGKRRNK
jgi:hypothetical protein